MVFLMGKMMVAGKELMTVELLVGEKDCLKVEL
jgi:hypothetical protein